MASTFIALPLSSSSISGPIDVVVNASTDSIRISDGTDTLGINADGSLNVNVVSGALDVESTYNEVIGVASGVTTLICSYTSSGNERVLNIEASGSNIAKFTVELNGNVIAQKYTNFNGPLNVSFDFNAGLTLVAADLVEVYVLHDRPYIGDFNSNILIES